MPQETLQVYTRADNDPTGNEQHEVFADWVNAVDDTTVDDYDRITELHSIGVVEIGDDTHAHFRP